MNEESIFVKCAQCGAKNRIPRSRLSDRPVCGRCGKQLQPGLGTPNHPVDVTDGSFSDEVIGFPGIVMAEFYAPWCGACRSLDPVINQVANEYSGRVKVAKVNVDRNPMTASHFQIQSTPTMILFKAGKVVNRLVGALPKTEIQRNLQAVL